MKRFFTLAAILLVATMSNLYAANPQVATYKFAERDTCSLYMDVYQPTGESKNTCIIYVFGGGFVKGSRTEDHNVKFFRDLSARGYTVAAIDYRLGLKGQTKVGAFNPKPPFVAVRLATEDLVSATSYIIKNADKLGVDTKRIVTIGSSAGAITVLQTEYELANRTAITKELPADFRYAGVVSLAGAIFSTKGKPVFNSTPSPIMLYHGTADNVVVYKKIQVLHLGMFGTDALVKIFNKEGRPYYAIRYKDCKHEVAEFPREYCQQQICDFIDMVVEKPYNNQIDVTVEDRYVLQNYKLDLKRKDLYNGN